MYFYVKCNVIGAESTASQKHPCVWKAGWNKNIFCGKLQKQNFSLMQNPLWVTCRMTLLLKLKLFLWWASPCPPRCCCHKVLVILCSQDKNQRLPGSARRQRNYSSLLIVRSWRTEAKASFRGAPFCIRASEGTDFCVTQSSILNPKKSFLSRERPAAKSSRGNHDM